MREEKNPAVKSRRYEQLLVSAGIYMDDDDEVAPDQGCKSMCQALLQTDQVVPQDSIQRQPPQKGLPKSTQLERGQGYSISHSSPRPVG